MNKYIGNAYENIDKTKEPISVYGSCMLNLCFGDTSGSCTANFCGVNEYSGCLGFACGVKGAK